MKKLMMLLFVLMASTALAQTEITREEFEATVTKKGFNRKCLHLSDKGRGFLRGLEAASRALDDNPYNDNPYSTIGTGFSVEVCTPANWIARRIDGAKRFYIDLQWEDLTEQDRVNLLHVVALPDRTTNLNVENSENVAHVVLRHPDKDKRKTMVVQPLFKRPFGIEQQNNLGGRAELEGIDSVFPFDALAAVRDEKGEFLITVVGEAGEKNFKVKTKHLDDLGLK